MKFANLLDIYRKPFFDRYGQHLLPSHLHAISAIDRCRTPMSGELCVRCTDCGKIEWKPLSCGHRSCPQCQNHETTIWIERQKEKLLPVDYFLVTFTLPAKLRSVAFSNQKTIFGLLFSAATSTLRDIGRNPKHLGAEIGMTAVLHTHNRRRDFHPHLHVIVPAGGVDWKRKQWRKIKGKFLFPQKALANVFRARILEGLNREGIDVPRGIRPDWIVDCRRMGKGSTVIEYLSRYLYRGVIPERDILESRNGDVTFRYTESETKKTCYRTLKGEEFLRLLLQHVLPKGFRRARDYGFLHGNAKLRLALLQLILHVRLPAITPRERPVFRCSLCQHPMEILGVRRQPG